MRGGGQGKTHVNSAYKIGHFEEDDMEQRDIWDAEAARSYDTPGTGMFDPTLLAATTSRLAELANGGRALEFAIGTGRVAIPLRARGVPVTGIELSEAMAAELRAKPEATGIEVVIGDMTSTAVPGPFALVYLVYNTISNVLTQSGQVEIFRNAARHLSPSGRFVVELEVPDLRRLPPGRTATVFTSEPGYIGVDTIDPLNQHLVSHHFRFGQNGREAHVFRSPHRYIWPSEMDLMAQLAGFTLESRHAEWAGSPFTAESTSHVSVYRLA
jgi:SAM-dependent methyltransferase